MHLLSLHLFTFMLKNIKLLISAYFFVELYTFFVNQQNFFINLYRFKLFFGYLYKKAA